MRAADAAGWLAAFGAEDVAVTVRFPQLGGWEVTSWAVGVSPAVERAVGGGPRSRGRPKSGSAPGREPGAPPAG